jgi:hypothetical protein
MMRRVWLLGEQVSGIRRFLIGGFTNDVLCSIVGIDLLMGLKNSFVVVSFSFFGLRCYRLVAW